MALTLPPVLAALVAAHNAHDSTAFLACFAEEPIVRDEGQKYFGQPAVRSWFEEISRKYDPVLDVTSVSTVDGEPVLTGRVSGNFDGSPVVLRYFTAVEDGKIVALKIAPS